MRFRVLSASVSLLLYLGMTGWNAGAFDREAARLKRWEPDVVALPRPEVAKFLSFGFDAVVADLFWIRSIQYFGDRKNGITCYAELGNFIELVNYLAPDFKSAYRFGGMAIPCNSGSGWVNIEAGTRVLERAVERFPDEWFFRLLLAYNYSAYLGRPRDAGDQLRQAVGQPGAPRYFASLATRLYATAGDLDGAALIADEIGARTDDPEVRRAMEERLAEIKAERLLRKVRSAIMSYRRSNGGVPPAKLDDLVNAGLLSSVDVQSPAGEIRYDSESGEVKSSLIRKRLEVTIAP